jgi:hypothetical protein
MCCISSVHQGIENPCIENQRHDRGS